MKKLIILFLLSIFIEITFQKIEERKLNLKDSDYEIGDLSEEELEMFRKLKKTNFDSFETKYDDIFIMKSMIVQNTGSYTLYSKFAIIWLFNSEGKALLSIEERGKIYLYKNDNVYAMFLYFGPGDILRVNIQYLNLIYKLPFDPINIIDESSFDKSSISKNPLTSAEVKYKKRSNDKYLYINSNNPENILKQDLNKALIRLDISNKEIFFTFEHNTENITTTLYSGFQVRNTGSNNLQVVIKNIGFQYNGKGYYLGQKEWIDFYNMKFKVKNKDKWDEKQKANFIKYINFDDNVVPTKFPTRTYVIPPGEYFYVIGGTTKDAYNNYNIFDTADKDVSGTVINGVVLFEVSGEAEGAYFIYNDINIPKTDTKSYQGYVPNRVERENVGAQYIGYDNCLGVVDNSMTWEFNDLTEEQYLPVHYKVFFSDTAPLKGDTAYSKIKTTEHLINSRNWTTHLNPHKFLSENNEKTEFRAVGTDMTKFNTINEKGEKIVIDNEHYDGRKILSNLGNWMIDYIDNFNFVNRGDKKRKVSVLIGHGNKGSLACFVRNSKLEIIQGTEEFTVYLPESNKTLHTDDKITDIYNYTFTVDPHSVMQIYVEYVLLANSDGNVTHSVFLGESLNYGFKISNKFIYLLIFLLGLLFI